MKPVKLNAQERQRLCEGEAPLPALVWGALWVALFLRALVDPDGPGTQAPAVMACADELGPCQRTPGGPAVKQGGRRRAAQRAGIKYSSSLRGGSYITW